MANGGGAQEAMPPPPTLIREKMKEKKKAGDWSRPLYTTYLASLPRFAPQTHPLLKNPGYATEHNNYYNRGNFELFLTSLIESAAA